MLSNLIHDFFHINIAGFEFLAKISESLMLENQLSEYPTQIGNTVNDNIFSKPLQLEVSAVLSDSVIKVPFANLEKKAIGTIGAISAFAPIFAQKAQNFVNNVFNDINKAINFAQTIKNAGLALYHILSGNDNSNMGRFLEFLLKTYNNKELVTIAFNNASFDNMVIENATVSKANDDGALQINIVFKQYTALNTELFNVNSPLTGVTGFLSNEAKKMVGDIHIGGLSL